MIFIMEKADKQGKMIPYRNPAAKGGGTGQWHGPRKKQELPIESADISCHIVKRRVTGEVSK
jgi:hypothetical protein